MLFAAKCFKDVLVKEATFISENVENFNDHEECACTHRGYTHVICVLISPYTFDREFSPVTPVIEVLYFRSSWIHRSGLGTCLGEAPLPELSRTENRGRYLSFYQARTENPGTTKNNCVIPISYSSSMVLKWAFERREKEFSRAEVAAAQSLSVLIPVLTRAWALSPWKLGTTLPSRRHLKLFLC